MNWNYKKLSSAFTILFIIGIVVVGYWLYNMPDKMLNTRTVDLNQVKLLEPLFLEYNLLIGFVLAIGLTAMVLHILNNSTNRKSDLIYVETFNKGQHEQELTDNRGKNSGKTEELLVNVEPLIASEENYRMVFNTALSQICKKLEASQAAVYQVKKKANSKYIELFASFAYPISDDDTITYKFGEGLAGQVAKEGKPVNLDSVPQGYIEILSGLGKATPSNLIILPFHNDNTVVGVVEIASFKPFTIEDEIALQGIFDKLALKLANNDNVSLEAAK